MVGSRTNQVDDTHKKPDHDTKGFEQDLTYEEAMQEISAVNQHTVGLVAALTKLKMRRGWAALGFKNWTQFLESKYFQFSRKHLDELMRAAPVQERLLAEGIPINHSVANALAGFTPEVQIAAVKTAIQRYGTVTESRAKRVATVLQQAVSTGYVEPSEGQSVALEDALSLEDREADLRAKAHWQGEKIAEFNSADEAMIWLSHFSGRSESVHITVYEKKESENAHG